MRIEKEIIIDLASQVYMGLSDEEVIDLSETVGNIVQDAEVIGMLDTSNIKADIAVLQGKCNVFRKDEVVEYKEKELLLQNACELHNDMFKIPKVV